jgi:hypothetical protein
MLMTQRSYLWFSVALIATGPLTPRTVDMTVALKDERGAALTDCAQYTADGKTCERMAPVTLGAAISHTLFAQFQDERDLSGDQRWARGELAMRIAHATTMQLTAEEVVTIKRCVGKAYPPLVVVQIYPAIDPNAEPPKLQ